MIFVILNLLFTIHFTYCCDCDVMMVLIMSVWYVMKLLWYIVKIYFMEYFIYFYIYVYVKIVHWTP
jgi:hypothetical protein